MLMSSKIKTFDVKTDKITLYVIREQKGTDNFHPEQILKCSNNFPLSSGDIFISSQILLVDPAVGGGGSCLYCFLVGLWEKPIPFFFFSDYWFTKPRGAATVSSAADTRHTLHVNIISYRYQTYTSCKYYQSSYRYQTYTSWKHYQLQIPDIHFM